MRSVAPGVGENKTADPSDSHTRSYSVTGINKYFAELSDSHTLTVPVLSRASPQARRNRKPLLRVSALDIGKPVQLAQRDKLPTTETQNQL
jgi:hypothetical protein